MVEKVVDFAPLDQLTPSSSALVFTRVLALTSGRFVLAGGLVGGLDAGPFDIAASQDAVDFSPVIIGLDETFTPTSFARIPTGQAEAMVTALADVGGMTVVAVASAGTGHMDTGNGTIDIPVWSGPALLAFDGGGGLAWLAKAYAPSNEFVVASIVVPPGSDSAYALALHRGTAIFGDGNPPVVIAPSDTEVTVMSIAGFRAQDGEVLGAKALTGPLSGLGQLSSAYVGVTGTASATPDGVFIGGRFAGSLQHSEATAGSYDGFTMRRNSHGGLLCK